MKSNTYSVFNAIDSKVFMLEQAPNYNISFYNGSGTIGTLDFNGPELVFTGNAEESAKIFMGWVAKSFSGLLQEERDKCQK